MLHHRPYTWRYKMSKTTSQLKLDACNKYYKTKKGLLGVIYKTQRASSKRRKHNPPTYTLDEFRKALLAMELFHILFDNWVASNYKKCLRPSVDRIDANKPYTEDNIQLMTWQENNEKGRIEWSRPVDQFTLDEEYITTHSSIIEAERQTGVLSSGIVNTCKGNPRYSHSGGFKWQYAS